MFVYVDDKIPDIDVKKQKKYNLSHVGNKGLVNIIICKQTFQTSILLKSTSKYDDL